MTDREVHGKVTKWLNTLTGVTVIKDHEGKQRPALPYIMVNFTTRRKVRERPQTVLYAGDTQVEATPVLEVEWMFSVHGYADRAPTDLLRRIVSAAELTQVTEPLWPDLSIHGVSEIRNVPEWVNEAWEPRAQIDMFVRGLVKDDHEVDVIEQYSFDFERGQN